MTGPAPSPGKVAALRRAFFALTFTRWFPSGVSMAVSGLLPLERGLSVAQAISVASFAAAAALVLELPTSGFADVFGRRPVLVAAALVQVVTTVLMAVGHGFAVFAVAWLLFGVFRALDSGPLEAWFVDAMLDAGERSVDQDLARQGVVVGGAIAGGAALSGLLVWWHPFTKFSALTFPAIVVAALAVAHLAAVTVLMRERRSGVDEAAVARALRSAAEAPGVVADGIRLLRHDVVLRSVVLVEVFWVMAMMVFERSLPIRLSELLTSRERASSLMGPVIAVGWSVFAIGSALASVAVRRLGTARAAIVGRLVNGAGATVMGLAPGAAALVGAYFVTYGAHGAGGATHSALLHRQASARNRATVLSINSMVMFGAMTMVAPAFARIAAHWSLAAAMTVAGAASIVGAALYLPARRAELTMPPADATLPDATLPDEPMGG